MRLSPEDVQRLLIARSPHGLYLEVDMSDFDEALLYFRGASAETREERNPWRLYLTKDRYKVHIFQRLFLLLKLKPTEQRVAEIVAATEISAARARRMVAKRRRHLPVGVSSDHIYVKVFKRIPQIDLEMLFPNTQIEFRPFDKLRLLVTAGGGTAAGVVGTATKLLAAANPITLAAGLIGLSAVIFRQVMSFLNTRNHYMMLLAQNLYFCSLANNRGALTLIADSAEEEDVKEDMLLYAFLARRPSHYDALAELKSAIEGFAAERCGVTVNFDAEDALRRLLADGLVRSDEGGKLTAIAPRGCARSSRSALGPAARRRHARPGRVFRHFMSDMEASSDSPLPPYGGARSAGGRPEGNAEVESPGPTPLPHKGGEGASPANAILSQVSVVAAAARAESIAARLEEAAEPHALAVSLFERRDGSFEVSALYAEPPAQGGADRADRDMLGRSRSCVLTHRAGRAGRLGDAVARKARTRACRTLPGAWQPRPGPCA